MQKRPSHISALISPPDEPIHSFNQPSSPMVAIGPSTPRKMEQIESNVRGLLSPTSPAIPLQHLAARFQDYVPPSGKIVNHDPILYPRECRPTEYNSLFHDEDRYQTQFGPRLQSPAPLIRATTIDKSDIVSPPETVATSITSNDERLVKEENRLKEAVIDDHYFKNFLPRNSVRPKSKISKWSKPRNFTPPTRDDYRLMISFTSTILKDLGAHPVEYVQQAREDRDEIYRAIKQAKIGASGYTTTLLPKDDRFLHKIKAAPLKSAPRTRKPVQKQMEPSGTPQPEKHKRNVIKKPKIQFNYDDLPDYTPSIDTIPSDKSFRVTWAGQPLDLSNDPNRHLLHPAELQLASKLRFPCDQYLKTKRRVFIGRVNNLIKYPHKQFCKTDAQQVGGVDVNKLSQLWEAYNSIGWFKDSHFKNRMLAIRDSALVYDPKNCKWVDNKDLFG